MGLSSLLEKMTLSDLLETEPSISVSEWMKTVIYQRNDVSPTTRILKCIDNAKKRNRIFCGLILFSQKKSAQIIFREIQ